MQIKNGNIRISRGEEFALQFRVKENGEPYKMKMGDRIQLTVKKLMIDSEKAVITRTAVGSDVIRVKGYDTEDLMYGKYRYMVQLIKSDGSRHTLVDVHNFDIYGGGA